MTAIEAILQAESPFPDPRTADEEGVVAEGGPFTANRLLKAYSQGIFPWTGQPIKWFSPDPRGIIWNVKLPRKIGKYFRRGNFTITYDTAFESVMRACAEKHQDDGIWITDEFVETYSQLYEMGYAHSVEVWQEGNLVGGLYGVQVKGLFAGESMFFRVSNASKVAFTGLVYQLAHIGTQLLDCQMVTHHTMKLGAVWVTRSDYIRLLDEAMDVTCINEGQKWPEEGFRQIAA